MAQAAVALSPPFLHGPAKNGDSCLSAALKRSRIALFLATAGLVAMGGGCAKVPSGDGGPGPTEMGRPVVAPPAVPASPTPAIKKHGNDLKHGDEGGEGGEGGEG
jgi:hypothetical protein